METGDLSSTSSVYCRTTSCLDDPQKTALDALLSGNMRLLSDLLAEESITVDTEKQYPEQGNKTLLHIAVENKNTEAVRILLAGGAQLGHFNSILKVTVLHLAAGLGDEVVLATLLRSSGPHAIQVVNIKDRAGMESIRNKKIQKYLHSFLINFRKDITTYCSIWRTHSLCKDTFGGWSQCQCH